MTSYTALISTLCTAGWELTSDWTAVRAVSEGWRANVQKVC